MKINLLLAASLTAMIASCGTDNTQITSPDGSIVFKLSNTDAGLTYTVSDSDEVVVDSSRLGFVLVGDEMLDKFDIKGTSTSSHDETWETTWGESRFVRDNYCQLTVEMKQRGGDLLVNLEVRVFDDGFGYRYVFPEQQRDSLVIMQELTEFVLPADDQVCYMSADNPNLECYFIKS